MLELHKKYNYVVNVESLDETAIAVTFPKNIFMNIAEQSVIISVTNDGISIENEHIAEYIDCKDYMIRPLIFKIIGMSTIHRNMDTELIMGLSEVRKLKTPDNLDKEQELERLCIDAIYNDNAELYANNEDFNDWLQKGMLL